MKSKRLNIILCVLILMGLWLPALVNHVPGIKRLTIWGYEYPHTYGEVSWWDGTAQHKFEQTLTDSSVARTYLLRVRNQYQYSLFGKINAESVYQFDDQFFRFYMYGFNESQNFVGLDTIRQRVSWIREIQDIIGPDIPIITVIAPSKSRYYEDRLPDIYHVTTDSTNYRFYLEELKKNRLHVVDFNEYFIQHPSEQPAIFGNGGIHWSHYAAGIAMDSLINYIGDVRGINFSSFGYKPYYSNGFNLDDLDIALMRNIFVRAKDDNLRNLKLWEVPRDRKVKAVIIGDSFFMTIQHMDLRNRIFSSDSPYYYYFGHETLPDYSEVPIDLQKVALQIKNADCIILMTDIVNFENYGFGFPQKVLPYLD